MTERSGIFGVGGWTVALLAGVLAVVASCGGGGVVGSGGTGRSAGLTVGTVNGFGSVVVDGLVYDERAAKVVAEVAPGVDAIADLRLGHRVAVDYEVAGVASQVRIEAAISGSVASIGAAGGLSVLGQSVTANSNGAVGPITQFGGGYAQIGDLRIGDPIEVHGVIVRQSNSYSIQATRIDKLAAAPGYLRVTGLASNVGKAGAGMVNLGALSVDTTNSTVLPAGAVLADGQALTVLALPSALTTPGGGVLRLKAAQIRVRQLGGGDLDDNVSGSVSNLDAGAKTFALGSLVVHYTNTSISPTGAAPSNGAYVLVRGSKAADGSLNATAVTLRDTGADDEGELKGNISAYVAATQRFAVRGVMVDASTASIRGCPSTGLVNGLFVEVQGGLVSTGVLAKTVACESESSGATVERSGVAGSVDTAAKTLTLTTKSGIAVSVKWADSTFFGGVTPSTLAGKTIQVEGQFNGSVLNASKIELED